MYDFVLLTESSDVYAQNIADIGAAGVARKLPLFLRAFFGGTLLDDISPIFFPVGTPYPRYEWGRGLGQLNEVSMSNQSVPRIGDHIPATDAVVLAAEVLSGTNTGNLFRQNLYNNIDCARTERNIE